MEFLGREQCSEPCPHRLEGLGEPWKIRNLVQIEMPKFTTEMP